MKPLLSFLVLGVALLVGREAFAGTLTINDTASYVSTDVRSRLQAESGGWPFDVSVLTENAASVAVLEDDAHKAVTTSNVLVIAIDPAHHKVTVRCGVGIGIKPGDYDSISSAGNVDFRAHDVAHGIESIVRRARASAEAKVAISQSGQPPVIVEHGLPASGWFGLGLLAVFIVGVIVWLVRRARQSEVDFKTALDENREETSELRSRNIEEQAWAEGVVKDRERLHAQVLGANDLRRATENYRCYECSAQATHRIGVVPYCARHPSASDVAPVSPRFVDKGGRERTPPTRSHGRHHGQVVRTDDRFAEGLLIGEALSRSERRRDDDDPPPVRHRRNDDDGGSTSSYTPAPDPPSSSSSSDDGGSTTSWDPPTTDFGGGGGGGNDGGGGTSSW